MHLKSVWRVWSCLVLTLVLVGCGGGSGNMPAPNAQAHNPDAALSRDGHVDTRLLAPTGATLRDFSLQVGGVELVPPYSVAVDQSVVVLPVTSGSVNAVVHWGDGSYSAIPGGWTPESPGLSHVFGAAGSYRIEYATLDPVAGWDSRLITINVGEAPPPPPPSGTFTRDFSVASNGQVLGSPAQVVVGQSLAVTPASALAQKSVVHWGDGSYTALAEGWKPGTLLEHSYTAKGTYTLEYATLSPDNVWDSKAFIVKVGDTEPPPPTGIFTRDFSITVGSVIVAPPVSVSPGQALSVVPASEVALASVIHWGDGTSTVIQGGWKATTPADLTQHVYANPGTYRIEYATLSPESTWDSRLVDVTVVAGGQLPVWSTTAAPRGDPEAYRRFILTSYGGAVMDVDAASKRYLPTNATVGLAQRFEVVPVSNIDAAKAARGVIDFGDGSPKSQMPDGWNPGQPPISHAYAAPGLYLVTYTTTSASGVIASTSIHVRVLPEAVTPPAASFRPPRAPTAAGPFHKAYLWSDPGLSIVGVESATGVIGVRNLLFADQTLLFASDPAGSALYRVVPGLSVPAELSAWSQSGLGWAELGVRWFLNQPMVLASTDRYVFVIEGSGTSSPAAQLSSFALDPVTRAVVKLVGTFRLPFAPKLVSFGPGSTIAYLSGGPDDEIAEILLDPDTGLLTSLRLVAQPGPVRGVTTNGAMLALSFTDPATLKPGVATYFRLSTGLAAVGAAQLDTPSMELGSAVFSANHLHVSGLLNAASGAQGMLHLFQYGIDSLRPIASGVTPTAATSFGSVLVESSGRTLFHCHATGYASYAINANAGSPNAGRLTLMGSAAHASSFPTAGCSLGR